MKTLVVILSTTFAVAVVAGFIVGRIETIALGQPDIPTPIYRHPHAIKSVVRYITDDQEQLYSISQPIMIASFVLSALLAIIYEILRRIDYNRRKQALLERIGT